MANYSVEPGRLGPQFEQGEPRSQWRFDRLNYPVLSLTKSHSSRLTMSKDSQSPSERKTMASLWMPRQSTDEGRRPRYQELMQVLAIDDQSDISSLYFDEGSVHSAVSEHDDDHNAIVERALRTSAALHRSFTELAELEHLNETVSTPSSPARQRPSTLDVPLTTSPPPPPTRSHRGGPDVDEDVKVAAPPLQPQRLTCQCCYEDISPSDYTWVSCASMDDLHCFCADCVRRLVEEFVFGSTSYPLAVAEGRLYLPCLSSQNCSGYLSEESIQHSVSMKVFDQYIGKMQSVNRTTTDDGPADANQELQGIPREIESPPLQPKNQQSTLDESYHAAEEALTDAKVRRCNVCHTKFLKEKDSCNKMRCPSCRYCMCYICRKPVESRGYEHWCRHRYDEPCQDCPGRCALWSLHDDKKDETHLRQVAEEMANRLWEESLLKAEESATTSDQGEVRIDVERLLRDPSQSERTVQ